jgi:nitroreductase/Pyruvate/2-oxoacid:ferredoxin oxidoreductase delta subunit
MKIEGIDKNKCTSCKECIKDCLFELMILKKDRDGKPIVEYDDPYERCIRCGHCIAVCSADAIIYSAKGQAQSFPGIEKPEKIVGYDSLSRMVMARRSVRRFKDSPLAQDDLLKIIEAMSFAPTASNNRSWEYVVITDPSKRRLLTESVMKMFKMFRLMVSLNWLMYPFLGKEEKRQLKKNTMKFSFDQALNDYSNNRDRILFDAPCVIILHSPEYANLAGNDAGIALTIGMFAAQSLGIGTVWSGFVEVAFARDKALRKSFDIPKGHKVRGVLGIGYPDVEYHRVPVREKPAVRFL